MKNESAIRTENTLYLLVLKYIMCSELPRTDYHLLYLTATPYTRARIGGGKNANHVETLLFLSFFSDSGKFREILIKIGVKFDEKR